MSQRKRRTPAAAPAFDLEGLRRALALLQAGHPREHAAVVALVHSHDGWVRRQEAFESALRELTSRVLAHRARRVPGASP